MSCGGDCWGHFLSEDGVSHLSKYRLTLGRAATCDIVLDDTMDTKLLSSQHAVVLHIGNCAIIVDTSLNGTYVNNRRITRAVLKPNDTIRLGKRRVIGGVPNPYQFIYMSKRPTASHSAPTVDLSEAESLKQTLTCPLCRDFLVFPSEVAPCSHLFCSSCIESFMSSRESDQCPLCSTELSTYKIRTKFNLVQIVDKALKLVLSKREFDSFSVRFTAFKHELFARQQALKQLRVKQEALEYSASSGDPFLLICQAWSQYERLKFFRGIARYPRGEARELYCWMVRLTEEWVRKDANETDISIALFNLDLMQEEWADRDVNQARDALVRYIYGKRQKSSSP